MKNGCQQSVTGRWA